MCRKLFQLAEKKRIRRRTYPTRETAKSDVFNYIELFYKPTRRRGNNGDLSPMEFENNYFRNQAGVSKSGGVSIMPTVTFSVHATDEPLALQ
jgi:putative transposase